MKKIWIVISVILVIAAVGVGGLIAWRYYSSPLEKPFEKTMTALFPEFAELADMEKQGRVELIGSIDADLYGELENPLDLKIGLDYIQDSAKLELAIGSDGKTLDAAALMDGNGIALSSSALSDGEKYGVRFENLKEALDASAFSPNGTSDYAMSQELYNFLTELSETCENTVSLETNLNKILDSVKKNLTLKSEEREVKLLDTTAEANVTEIKFDLSFLTALAEATLDDCREDESFCNLIAGFLTAESDPSAEGAIAEVENLVKKCKEAQDSYTLSGTLTAAEHDGYLVLFEAELLITDKESEKGSALTFAWTLTQQPKEDPRFTLTLNYEANEETVYTYTADFERSEENGDVKYSLEILTEARGEYRYAEKSNWTLEIAEDGEMELNSVNSYAFDYQDLADAEFEEDTELEVHGSLTSTEDSLSLTVDKISLITSDIRMLDMKKSSFTLTLSSERPSLGKSTDAADLCRMTAEELDSVRASIHSAMLEKVEKINTACGVTLLQYGYTAQELGTAVSDSYSQYAYDPETKRLFLVVQTVKSNSAQVDTDILVYDTDTMRLVDTISLDDTLTVMLAADNGNLLILDREEVSLYDAASLTKTKTLFSSSTYDFNMMLLDGNSLYLISGLEFIHYDISTDKAKFKNLGTQINWIQSASLDRESHTLCLTGEKYNNRSIDIIGIFNSETGEEIFYWEYGYGNMSKAVSLVGKAFYTFEHYRAPDGSVVRLSSLTPQRKNQGYYVDRVIYSDDAYFITLENSTQGEFSEYFVYAVTENENGNEPVGILNSYDVQAIIPISENEFLVYETFASESYFTKIKVSQTWFLGEGISTAD